MKTKSTILALSYVAIASSFGAVYNVTTGTIATSNGIASTGTLSDPSAPAAVGSFTGYQSPGSTGIVAFGVFGTTNSSIFTQSTDAQITGAVATGLSSLVATFVQFGASGGFNATGAFGTKGVFTRNTSATVTGSVFTSRNIYALIGNGTTFANSSELLVLKSTSLFEAAQDAIPTAQTVTLNTASASLLFGRNLADVRTTTADASATPGWGTAQAVPEPSTALLGAIGALGILRRRRN